MENRAAHPQTVFVTLPAPASGLVLWRVIERVAVEKQLEARQVTPAANGQNVAYSYTVKGGGGGPFPVDEAATMTAKLFLSESALQMTTDAIAIAGKAGYLRENGLERLHRDALGIVIAAPINGQVLGSIGESLRQADRSSHLYKV